jgi:hypothetical protein
MPSDTDSSARWRALAAEALAISQELTYPAAKRAMLEIAEKYMELAERVAQCTGTIAPVDMESSLLSAGFAQTQTCKEE